MLRRQARLRREYIYKKSVEDKERIVQDKRQKLRKAIEENRPIPNELQSEALDLHEDLEWDDSKTGTEDIDDEYKWAGSQDPKVMITTSRDPSSKLKQFSGEVRLIIPNSQRMNRGGYDIKELVNACRANDVTDFIILHETRGTPSGVTVCHLPLGPTAYFNLSNVVMRHDIADVGKVSEEYPHLIFNNLKSKLGQRTMNILKYLFPVPKKDTKRIVTFSNDQDFISFRHHTYKRIEGTEIELTEIGPRFEMKLYCIKLGTLEAIKAADTEWILRPYMNTAKKRQFLSIQESESEDEL